MGAKLNDPYLAFGGKIDPLSEIRNAGIITSGDVYWVKAVGDSAHNTLKDAVGADRFRDTIQDAIDKTTSDANDYVLVAPQDANAAYALSSAVDFNKNRIHVLSVGYNKYGNGYRNTVRGFATTSTVDTEVFSVNGAGVEIAGFKFQGTAGTSDNGTTTAIGRLGTSSAGTPHGLYIHDTVIENTNAAGPGGTAPALVSSGDVAAPGIQGYRFERVTFSSPSWFPAILVNLAVSGTAGPSEFEFNDCLFTGRVQATTNAFLNLGTGVTRYGVIKNTTWLNTNEGTLPASAVIGALLADNPVILANNSAIGVTQQGTDTQAYKTPASTGTQAAVFDYAIGVGTAALGPS